jgi:NAD(P)-dependent dehydrogenase (short-subunit alcohol dehydrogenase family)
MDWSNRVAVITGGASGIGRAICRRLGREGVKAIGMVDYSDSVVEACREVNSEVGRDVCNAFRGDVTDKKFRRSVFDEMTDRYGGVHTCVPAAGIVRDALAVKVDKVTGRASLYDQDIFEKVVSVNLTAATYWALETIASVAEQRFAKGAGKWTSDQPVAGEVCFIGSISSLGNKGQVSYASTKAALEGVRGTLAKECAFYGIRCCIVHPGFTDTPMVRAMDQTFVKEQVLPKTQLGRLITPDEMADAIVFMLSNPAASGRLFADAGWHPPA